MTTNMGNFRRSMAIRTSLIAILASQSTLALAQSGQSGAAADDAATEIVITGTSIRGVAPVGAPVVTLDQEAIQAQPATTTAELLRQVPSVVGLGANDQYFGGANGSAANITSGNGINLRGLGTTATLTLLNGRRLAPAGTQAQFFDPSVFPTSAIGRMEVMADGGSAVYGSDAVGGVVNIVTRRPFSGLEVYAKSGISARGDAPNLVLGGVGGVQWGGGSAVISYEYNRREALKASSRTLYTDDLRPYGGSDQRLFAGSPGNIQVGGTRYAIPAGQDGTNLLPSDLIAGAPNRQSAFLGADAIPGQERHSVLATIRQDITPDIEIWAEGFYTDRKSDRKIGPITSNLTVPSSNPFFVHPTNPAASSVLMNYSFSGDFGSQQHTGAQLAWQGAAGFEANLGSGVSLSGYGSYSGNDDERHQPVLNIPQMQLALADTSPATAFNPFGSGGQNNPATLANILGFRDIGVEYRMADFGLKLDGPLFDIGGGAVRFAVGGEYQDHHLNSYFRDNANTPNVSTISYRPSYTKRTVKSVYGELYVPLVSSLNGSPGLEELSLAGAVRYDDYSDFGSTVNPKLSFSYRPLTGLSFRGTYGRSFRAPTLSDIDPSVLTIAFQDFTDPSSPSGQTRTLWVRGSNLDLGPERATTWSLGADFAPVSVPGLRLGLTYFNVNYKDRIEGPGSDVLALTPAREPLLGDLVVRNPSADLVNFWQNSPYFYTGVKEDPATIGAYVDGRKVNVGLLETDGLEGTLDYAIETGAGTVNLGVAATYLLNYKRKIAPNSVLEQDLDTINNPSSLKGRGTLGYQNGGFAGNVYFNYTKGYLNDSIAARPEVPAYFTTDMSLRYTIDDPAAFGLNGVTFSLDVQNLFDRDPPIVLAGNLPYDAQVASIMGRYITAGVRFRW
ncbi:MAG: TonB-dependent receptor [Alphaproteobacteria bacterium]|nr:TonB-dependent receptor [Alphaproteobacteria bacterium]MBU0832089.1 TonB-dependent receptor [Alphaproteobacteria bacterium]MBU1769905.1 TonB-dependent receptor [Alphaproteobacteria bacterium]